MYKILSALYFASVSADVQVLSHLFRLRYRGDTKKGAGEGLMAGAEAHCQMPSLSSRRL